MSELQEKCIQLFCGHCTLSDHCDKTCADPSEVNNRKTIDSRLTWSQKYKWIPKNSYNKAENADHTCMIKNNEALPVYADLNLNIIYVLEQNFPKISYR